MTNEIVQSDNGTLLNLTVQDNNGNIVDLRPASSVELAIRFTKIPTIKTAIITDAQNGKCQVTLTSDDLQNIGIFAMQCTVNFEDGNKFASDIQMITINKNIRI